MNGPEYACPNCGASVRFASRFGISATCQNCRSYLVRHDRDLTKVGEQSEFMQDMSPFQIGTTGRYEGKGFTLFGRLKVKYPKGTWNEWYALMDDGSEAWLAEAQGFYMMSQAIEDKHIPPKTGLKIGKAVDVGEHGSFVIMDIKEVTYAGSDGELPFEFKPNFRATSVDAFSTDDSFVSFLYEPGLVQGFVGHYLPFESFSFDNLKEIHGWERL
ncbi:MAG: DUF4178 domain-containing protein [Bacteroidia bacterium]